ncbi:MAG: hypothetical protein N2748_05240, partial [candidate division WOR-3 bacterium]|nr:hypothetical protein [candidate division WOR-3 bacterium]
TFMPIRAKTWQLRFILSLRLLRSRCSLAMTGRFGLASRRRGNLNVHAPYVIMNVVLVMGLLRHPLAKITQLCQCLDLDSRDCGFYCCLPWSR